MCRAFSLGDDDQDGGDDDNDGDGEDVMVVIMMLTAGSDLTTMAGCLACWLLGRSAVFFFHTANQFVLLFLLAASSWVGVTPVVNYLLADVSHLCDHG